MKILKKILIGLAAVLVIALAVLYLVPAAEKLGKEKPSGKAWMAELPDDLKINKITIPGTHDSASRYAELPFFSSCQYLSLRDQLESGYRYLDIRLGNPKSGGSIRFYHGFCLCTKSFYPGAPALILEEELASIYDFLDSNPTETVVFCVKMEQGSDARLFQSVLTSCIQKDPEHWYVSDTLPTLGECRGKLVLLRRYNNYLADSSLAGISIKWSDQNDKANGAPKNAVLHDQESGYSLVVQDRFKYDAGDKWTAFTEGLNLITDSIDELSLHFLSTNGSAAYGHPYKYAKELNKRFMDFDLSSVKHPVWIITDFSGSALAEHIYQNNFR